MIPQKKPYFISASNAKLTRAILATRKLHPVNILITGRHGLGKSELARQISAYYNLEYYPISINLLQESGQLIGHDEYSNGVGTHFDPSVFVQAIQKPNTLVHLEELNRPESSKAIGELFPLLDDARMIVHDKLGEVKVANGTVFVATLNEGYEYTGIDPLDSALRDRFYFIQLDYLPAQHEVVLVLQRTGLLPEPAEKLVKFVNSLRQNSKEPIHISTRRVLMMAELMVGGLSLKSAIIACVGVDKDKLESILMAQDFRGEGTPASSDDGYVMFDGG